MDMSKTTASEISTYLRGSGEDVPRADQLFTLAYDELKLIAQWAFQGQDAGHVLQPTALVHEIWVKLSGQLDSVTSLDHFLALAARAMRQILIDIARSENRQKRGAGRIRLSLDEATAQAPPSELGLLEFAECLERLGEQSPRSAQVAELRLFGSLPMAAVADLLSISEATAKREWRYAKAWIMRAFKEMA
ncbi:MAG: ECF-type sigma factor [Phycisphaerales bacterium]